MAVIYGKAIGAASAGGGGEAVNVVPTFTGTSQIFGTPEKGYIELYSSGTLTFNQSFLAQMFLVGGGGGGAGGGNDGTSSNTTNGGGGGGYTGLFNNIPLRANEEITVLIGAGGVGGAYSAANAGQPGGATSVGELTVAGGEGGVSGITTNGRGGNGGSGGGAGSGGSGSTAGKGGSNGSDGGSSNSGTVGKGQQSTTREFMETQGRLFAGGGGGGGGGSGSSGVSGGSGGTGSDGGGNGGQGASYNSANGKPGTDAVANTGSGGGAGGAATYGRHGGTGGNGGSGIAIIRWGNWGPDGTLGSMTAGDEIEILENGVLTPFIVLSQGYPAAGRTLVMRKKIAAQMQYGANAVYTDSYVDEYCENEYLTTLDESVQAVITAVDVLYHTQSRGLVTLQRRGFVLSTTELGLSGSNSSSFTDEGTAITAFTSGAVSRSARFGETLLQHYLRSIMRSTTSTNWTNVWTAGTSNNIANTGYTNPWGVRPCFTLPQDAVIKNGKVEGVTSWDLAAVQLGSTIKLLENGVGEDFIVLARDYPVNGRTLLLRRDIAAQLAMDADGGHIYAQSTADAWCNDDYINTLDASVREKIAAVDILSFNTDTDTNDTLSRKVFLLSFREMGFTVSATPMGEGAPIPYFTDATTRIATFNGADFSYWSRSKYDGGDLDQWWSVNFTGTHNNPTVTTILGMRPAFTLPNDTQVAFDGTVL